MIDSLTFCQAIHQYGGQARGAVTRYEVKLSSLRSPFAI